MSLQEIESLQTQSRARGRPMSAQAGKAILSVTSDLLQEIGYANLTIEAIAERAGVGKSTVYRRYPSKADVVFAVLGSVADESSPKLLGRDFAEDLTAWVLHVVARISKPPVLQAIPGLLADCHRNPALLARVKRDFFGARRASSRSFVTDAIAKGQIRVDVDPDSLMDLIVGALHYRLLFTGQPTDRKFARQIADQLLKGVAG